MFKEINNLRPFLEDPQAKISVRNYAKMQKIAPATASKILRAFEQKHILKKQQISNIHFYGLTQSQLSKDIKVFAHIQNIRNIIDELNQFFGKPTIVLFGSTAKGEDVKESDYDVYIESEVTQTFDTSNIEKLLKKPLQLFVYKNIQDVPNTQLQQNIINGIVLQGELRWS